MLLYIPSVLFSVTGAKFWGSNDTNNKIISRREV